VGGGVGNGTGGFPVRADRQSFGRGIIEQESGGRYGIPNAEGSGAIGLGQTMPDTAKALAARLKLPFRPDLLKGNTPEARKYQDAIANAALDEAWAYGKGNPELAAYYYFAGPDKRGWGPKTKQYGKDILRRMGSGK
jgi:soluble lytic murein transglycosylase-like protein